MSDRESTQSGEILYQPILHYQEEKEEENIISEDSNKVAEEGGLNDSIDMNKFVDNLAITFEDMGILKLDETQKIILLIPTDDLFISQINRVLNNSEAAEIDWPVFIDNITAVSEYVYHYLPGYQFGVVKSIENDDLLLLIKNRSIVYDYFNGI